MNEQAESHHLTQLALDEKRNQCTEAELRATKIEDHYLSVTQKAHDRQTNELKVCYV